MLNITPDELVLADDVNVDEGELVRLISRAVARAAVFAPCVDSDVLTGRYLEAAKGVLIDVISRRANTQGLIPGTSGAVTAGGRTESVDTKDLKTLFWPHEIVELQSICAAATSAAAAVVAPVYSFPDPPGRFPDPAEPERRFPRW